MVYSGQNAALIKDKQHFFSTNARKSNSFDFKGIDKQVRQIDYSFLLANRSALETEFTEMFTLLQKEDSKNKAVFWLYCYYCASMLEQFYRAYGQKSQEEDYKQIKKKIKRHLTKKEKKDDKQKEESFIQSLYHSFLTSINNLVNAPFHIAQIRNHVAYANLLRLYWTFTRLTLVQGLSVAKSSHLIDKLDALLHTHTDVDKIISTIQAPSGVLNYFSVGFFLARFLIDGALLLKHTFFPSSLEKDEESGCELHRLDKLPAGMAVEAYRGGYLLVPDDEGELRLYYVPKKGKCIKLNNITTTNSHYLASKLENKRSVRLSAKELEVYITHDTHVPEKATRYERFKNELYKRHCNFANDLVWALINFLTNFNKLCHISGPVAGYLTAAFLTFDIAMMFYKCHLAEKEYLTKKAQYEEEIRQWKKDPTLSEEERQQQIAMLKKQLKELEINWQTKQATFYFNAAAATLLFVGFTAALLLNPALAVGAFFVCVVAAAMYLSSDSYTKYKEKSLYLEQAQRSGTGMALAIKDYQKARNDFFFTMTKNTVVPLLLITTYAICWPAAVALTAMYLGYELIHAYQQHQAAKTIKAFALPTPPADEEKMAVDDQPVLCC